MKTFIANEKNMPESSRRWYFVDAKGQILGRMASRIATVIRGKHRRIYTPNFDTGDHVVVINAEKVRVTGRKLKEKQYLAYSGYPGGLKKTSLEVMLATKPVDVIRAAVRKMLPANPLSRRMIKKLYVYAGKDHPHKKINFTTLEVKS